ncbi:sugar ABC transporter permease [Siccirubricoccus sp. KC 17139]|uniref:Sugar ABC transporter permease n=1 Tax=Siccirubricoccus soli TaxID=2899147 RepID=A0ABT1CYA7_9PROT|nr:sugar ABC transporter permease [Siccirubricoccus soli]MCO6414649.1 sugar ABC transporter permease [Siccirubricoccus soli]MCP2680779.1 sugar ABC transporter permease [Siccirubricoccus soli]
MAEHARHPGARAEAIAAWLLALPALLLMWAMLLGPALAVLLLSFTDWSLGEPEIGWAGLGNYLQLADDPVFWQSLRNTLIYVGVSVPATVGLGLGAALLVESVGRGRAFYRAAYFLPVASTLLAMALVWEFMFHPTVGFVTQGFRALGLPTTDWLQNPDTALLALAVIGIWQNLGLAMVLFVAGLQGIPRDLYEALAMDGADGAWERFRRVTWPMLGPALVFVVAIIAIRSFQVFDTVAVLTEGGPNKATEVLLHTMVQEGFRFLRTAYGAAITVIFLVFTLAVTVAQTVLLDRRAHYG